MGDAVLETLQLPNAEAQNLAASCAKETDQSDCPCVLCDTKFDDVTDKTGLLEHFLLKHKLVIADVNLISDFKRYVVYWKKRFSEQPVSDFCYLMETNTSKVDTGPQEKYYFLCDNLPEDHDVRTFIKNHRLSEVLEAQQKERSSDTFCHTCLFCRHTFTGNRSDLLNHMTHDHAFNLGHPDNIVFIEEFLDKLQSALTSLQCLFCEKTFKDRPTLKEHMRKKQHRQLNPKNTTYDKYYVVNYLEPGKNWEIIQKERDVGEVKTIQESSHDREFADWMDESNDSAVCLFCTFSSMTANKLLTHMKSEHDFDLEDIKTRLGLTFYQQIKLINYIRRQVHLCVCYGCGHKATNQTSLLDHMTSESHMTSLPDMDVWNQSLYYFPTYENDRLLCCLDDDDDDTSVAMATCSHDNVDVIPEDTPILQTDNSILQSAQT